MNYNLCYNSIVKERPDGALFALGGFSLVVVSSFRTGICRLYGVFALVGTQGKSLKFLSFLLTIVLHYGIIKTWKGGEDLGKAQRKAPQRFCL